KLIFPLQGTFLYDVDESTNEHHHEHQHCKKTFRTQFSKIYRIRIKENNLYIEQHEKDGDNKVFYTHGFPRISNFLDTRFEVNQLIGCFPLGTQNTGKEK